MEDTIEALLNEYLSNYKTFQTIFNFGTVLLIAIINIIVGFYLKSKLEDVKLKNNQELSNLNLINKKSEIKFQKYQLEQAEVLKNLYSQLIDIKFLTNSLFNEESYSDPHYEFKSRLTKWVNTYWTFYNFYSKNRILLNQNLIDLIRADLSSLNEVFSIIFKKMKDIEELEKRYTGQLEYAYIDQYDEEASIISQLKELSKKLDTNVNKFKFIDLITNLEDEYVNLMI